MAHTSPSPADIKDRDDITQQLQTVKALQKSYEELGPIYDVIAFHDGSVWRAALDASEVRQGCSGTFFGTDLWLKWGLRDGFIDNADGVLDLH